MFRAKYTSCYKSFETVLSRGPRPTPPIFNSEMEPIGFLLREEGTLEQINSISSDVNKVYAKIYPNVELEIEHLQISPELTLFYVLNLGSIDMKKNKIMNKVGWEIEGHCIIYGETPENFNVEVLETILKKDIEQRATFLSFIAAQHPKNLIMVNQLR